MVKCVNCGEWFMNDDALEWHSCLASKPKDAINPPHYKTGRFEVIEIMEDKMSHEQFKGYLQGNVLKYVLRHEHKGKPIEDLKKAQWYLTKLIETLENNDK